MKYFEKVTLKKKSIAWLWPLPFIGFLFGYAVATLSLQKREVCVPNVVGKDVATSVLVLSRSNLGTRILQQREDDLLPHGTVIEQLPRAMQKARFNHNVLLTISVKKQPLYMPDMWSKRRDEALAVVANHELDIQEVVLQGSYPADMCIAQVPAAQSPIQTKKAILYFSSGRSGLSVMPNLIGAGLQEVIETLKMYDIRAEIFHDHEVSADHACTACTIIDQQPASGAIVDVRHNVQVQFKVTACHDKQSA